MTAPKTSGNKAYLDLTITDQDFDQAQAARSHSGRCMIAQAITAKYGIKAYPIVDADFIRFTSPETGDRLFYRTPPTAAAALISFDAGIKPQFPVRIRTNIVFERRGRHQNEAPVSDIRDWARNQPEYAGQIGDTGTLSTEVTDAYREAHPGVKIHSTHRKALTIKASPTPKMVIGEQDQPKIGNLHNAKTNIPNSRRRTWGSRTLTRELIDQGWIIPDNL